ncbi:hypothetical protein SAMD00024442_68_3 [Candidatus Symbiothrix dinenymphae]|nr:hypothetical protein SAMD00024442_68_3 [Candidatus Symbiothrix dinenymphae]
MTKEKKDMDDVMTQPFTPSKIKVRPQTISLDAMVERIKHGEIDLATKFQRKEGLWSDEQQSRLIESILIRLPLPVFYFDGSNNDKWLIIDGLQRLTTFKRFMVDKDLRLSGLEYLSLNNKKWDDLDRPQQRQINETQLQCYVLEEGEDSVKFNIFKRINTGGLTLSAQEIRHAMHQDVAVFLENLASTPEFKRATRSKIKPDRMEDRDFVNRFLAFYLLDYATEYSKSDDLDTFMNRALSKLSKLPDGEKQQIEIDFKNAMQLSYDIFGKFAFSKQIKQNRTNKALFEVVSVHFAKLDKKESQILTNKKTEFKKLLYKAIKERFKSSLSGGTGEQSRVVLRHKEFNNVLNTIFNEV